MFVYIIPKSQIKEISYYWYICRCFQSHATHNTFDYSTTDLHL